MLKFRYLIKNLKVRLYLLTNEAFMPVAVVHISSYSKRYFFRPGYYTMKFSIVQDTQAETENILFSPNCVQRQV